MTLILVSCFVTTDILSTNWMEPATPFRHYDEAFFWKLRSHKTSANHSSCATLRSQKRGLKGNLDALLHISSMESSQIKQIPDNPVKLDDQSTDTDPVAASSRSAYSLQFAPLFIVRIVADLLGSAATQTQFIVNNNLSAGAPQSSKRRDQESKVI
ncbi:hypothetical protein BJ742DRAFT_465850 [Cladochytrium replicatum]|nr:hypothetical protein BJ742DRAFT_465850 [Cladochytrium replicatum]